MRVARVLISIAIFSPCALARAQAPDWGVIQQQIEAQQEELREQKRRIEAQERELERQRHEIEELRRQSAGQSTASQDRPPPDASDAGLPSVLPELPGIWRPQGDTAMKAAGAFGPLSLALGMQYRVMYNASNIPGPGGTTFSDTDSYDFFRQRLRLNLSMSPTGARGGGFLQAEFRGGYGGSSPNASDPRGEEPTLNPFNQLEARGIRYGYLWAEPWDEQMFLVGVLPLSDQLGDTLFSADWDFNLGGIALLGGYGSWSYRLGYLRLIDGVGSIDTTTLADDGDFALADLIFDRSGSDGPRVGLHTYFLHVDEGLPLGGTDEGWLGLSVEKAINPAKLRGFAVLNTGQLGLGVLDDDGQVVSGFEDSDAHTGYALKTEAAGIALGKAKLDVQGLYASGDGDGISARFVTPQGLLGTEGYWGYTHVFTANPASDVNDLAVDLGNGGAGLLTLQGRISVPLHSRIDGQLFGGWFRADRARSGSHDLGGEIGLLLTVAVSEGLSWDLGAAGAFVGDFYADDADDLFEAFSRLQFQY